MIDDYQKATAILKDNQNYINSRTDIQMRFVEERDKKRYHKIRQFHSSWLMYSDGVQHEKTRKSLLTALKEAEGVRDRAAILFLKDSILAGHLRDKEIEEATALWHREFMGMTLEQQHALFRFANPLLSFFYHDIEPQGGIDELERNIGDLEGWLSQQSFDEKALLHKLIEQGPSSGAILNVVMDSYEPLNNALSALVTFYVKSGNSGREASDEIDNLLRLYPPFRYINRVIAGSESKVMIDLMSCNKDENIFGADLVCPNKVPHLSFGRGAHSCPGAKASKVFLTGVWNMLNEIPRERVFSREEPVEDFSTGYCRYKGIDLVYV